MKFEEIKTKYAIPGQEFLAGDYKVVHYDYSCNGRYTEKRSNWHAYKRIQPCGLFGNDVNPNQREYKTRKQAEKACRVDLRED